MLEEEEEGKMEVEEEVALQPLQRWSQTSSNALQEWRVVSRACERAALRPPPKQQEEEEKEEEGR